MSKEEEFTISSKEEALKFEDSINKYCIQKIGLSFKYIPLGEAFEFSKNDRKLFSIIFDLKISFISLASDYYICAILHNSSANFQVCSALDDINIFSNRMEIHRNLTSFILKYRALYDKILGFYVYTKFSEQKYQEFCQSRSRVKFFRKIFEIKKVEDNNSWSIADTIESFDKEYRTAEAHLSGKLRKYSFLVNQKLDSPVVKLSGYFNNILERIEKISDEIKK